VAKLLEIKNIETYYDLIYAIRGVSLSVENGTISTILGNNGAGKSTILKTVMGLLEDQPDKGTIEFNGERIDGKDTEDIFRMGLAYIPEGREIFEEGTVRENILLGAYIRKDRVGIHEDIERIFEYFPVLRSREKMWAGKLSGGEQQMLAIGRGLMSRPKLLLLDEPSLGLSPILVQDIFKIIQTIREEGTTILLVEQNARMALSITDSALILENGRIVKKGTSKEMMEDKDVQEFYMGVRAQESAKGYQRYKRKKLWS